MLIERRNCHEGSCIREAKYYCDLCGEPYCDKCITLQPLKPIDPGLKDHADICKPCVTAVRGYGEGSK